MAALREGAVPLPLLDKLLNGGRRQGNRGLRPSVYNYGSLDA